MSNTIFTVVIQQLGAAEVSYIVIAPDENSAKHRAIKGAGLIKAVGVTATILADTVVSDSHKAVGAALPSSGWIVTATRADGLVVEQQFLVALDDRFQAIEAAKHQANPLFVLALGSRVEMAHLVRRNMKLGDVFELGSHRIARGKNEPR